MSSTLSLVPAPAQVILGEGEFELTPTTSVCATPDTRSLAAWLVARLHRPTGWLLPLVEPDALGTDPLGPAIVVRRDPALGAGAFEVRVTAERVDLTGGDDEGIAHGMQVMLQLLPPQVYRSAPSDCRWSLPAVAICDTPRHRWRGVMLDVARHFVPKREILRYIDLLAMHRLNVLHLHLTDDQGWRMQIRAFPLLTEVGAGRTSTQVGTPEDAPENGRPHGGFYTQDDLREIVAYAAQHRITVVPEIDCPGHVQAAIAAYPWLGACGQELSVRTRWGVNPHVLALTEEALDFFRQVFDEVVEIFPSPFIGIGGDECPKQEWLDDPDTVQRLAALGADTGEQMQSWFVRQLDRHLATHGRRLFGWDEILEGELEPSATVASWRGMDGAIAAAQRGHDVVACPREQVYLDWRQSDRPDEPIPYSDVLSLADVHAFDPVPGELTQEQARHVLGAQACVWTEHIDSARMVDYYAFPRLCAFAEAVWRAPQTPDFTDFEDRLDGHLRRLDAAGVEYRAAEGPLLWQTRPEVSSAGSAS